MKRTTAILLIAIGSVGLATLILVRAQKEIPGHSATILKSKLSGSIDFEAIFDSITETQIARLHAEVVGLGVQRQFGKLGSGDGVVAALHESAQCSDDDGARSRKPDLKGDVACE